MFSKTTAYKLGYSRGGRYAQNPIQPPPGKEVITRLLLPLEVCFKVKGY